MLIPPSTDGPSRLLPTHRFFFCSWLGCCHTSLIPSWFSYSDLHSCADSSELPEIFILYNRLTSLLSISFNQQRIKSNFLASMQDSPPPGVHLCGSPLPLPRRGLLVESRDQQILSLSRDRQDHMVTIPTIHLGCCSVNSVVNIKNNVRRRGWLPSSKRSLTDTEILVLCNFHESQNTGLLLTFSTTYKCEHHS